MLKPAKSIIFEYRCQAEKRMKRRQIKFDWIIIFYVFIFWYYNKFNFKVLLRYLNFGYRWWDCY